MPQATSSVRPAAGPRSPASAPRARRPSRAGRGRRSRRDRGTSRRTPARVCRSTPSPTPRVSACARSSPCRTSARGATGATIDAIGDALAAHARLLDVHADADHNRSVFTLVGTEDELAEALVAGGHGRAGAHRPAHARGRAPADRRGGRRPDRAARARDMERAERAARRDRAAARRGARACPCSCTRRPSGGRPSSAAAAPRSSSARIDAGELAPDFGPPRLHERAGAVLVGARRPLIAFNVNLRGELAVAREIAGSCASAGAASPACARSVSTCRARVSCRSP